MASLNTHLSLARLSNSPTIVSNVIAAIGIVGIRSLRWELLPLFASLVLFYTAGMYLNDYFDSEYDLEHQNYRPIAKGEISRNAVGLIGSGLLLIATIILWVFYQTAFIYSLILVVFILGYNIFHKKYSLSIILMALSRSMVYVLAVVTVSSGPEIVLPAALLGSYVLGLTWLARNEEENRGINFLAIMFLFLPVLVAGLDVLPLEGQPIKLLIPLALVLWTIWCLTNIEKGRMGLGIGGLIAGIALLDAMLLSSYGGSPQMVYYCLGLFGLTLFFQRYIRGT